MNLFANERRTKGSQNRNAPTDGRLKDEVDVLKTREGFELSALGGNQGLVGRDDTLAGAQCGVDVAIGIVDTTGQLDHDVDVITSGQCQRVGCQKLGGNSRAYLAGVAHGDGRN